MSDADRQNLRDRTPDERDTVEMDAAALSHSIRMAYGGRAEWKPSASFGRPLGIMLVGIATVFTAGSLWQVLSAADSGQVAWFVITVVAAVLTASIGYLLYGLSTMCYRLSSDHLAIEWLNQRTVVAFSDIRDVMYDPHSIVPWPQWEPFWPGYHVSTIRAPDGVWRSWATQAPRRRVRIVTSQGVIAISPERPILFLEELDRRIASVGSDVPVAPVQPVYDRPRAPVAPYHAHSDTDSAPPQAISRPSIVTPERERRGTSFDQILDRVRSTWSHVYGRLLHEQILSDQVTSSLVAVGLLIPVLMAAWLYSRYEGLPQSIPLHWDAQGQVDQVGTPSDLWRFPLIAFLIYIANTAVAALVAGVDRFLARLLTAATLVAQVVTFIALVRIAA